MDDADGTPNDSLFPEWLRGKRQAWIAAGLLWTAAAALYGLDLENAADTGDLAVGVVFAVVALCNFAVAAFADPSRLQKRNCSRRWSWGG